jgi:hypothetical protein
VIGNLIWAGAFFIPLMAVVLGLLGPARRALAKWGDTFGQSAAEHEAAAVKALAEAEGERHDVAVRRGALAEEVQAEKARLVVEAARLEVDAAAARECLPAAVEARQKALAARAGAEADLAPEAARAALGSGKDMGALGKAYAVYCQEHPSGADLMGFGEWAGNYAGAGQ